MQQIQLRRDYPVSRSVENSGLDVETRVKKSSWGTRDTKGAATKSEIHFVK